MHTSLQAEGLANASTDPAESFSASGAGTGLAKDLSEEDTAGLLAAS